jgi:hypothetical protein
MQITELSPSFLASLSMASAGRAMVDDALLRLGHRGVSGPARLIASGRLNDPTRSHGMISSHVTLVAVGVARTASTADSGRGEGDTSAPALTRATKDTNPNDPGCQRA